MKNLNSCLIIVIIISFAENARSFDYFSSKKEISVTVKTSPEPNRPIPPAISKGIVIWLTDLINKGIKNPKASLDKKDNKLSITWGFGTQCPWYVFPKAFPILVVFKDKNGLEVGSYFSKRADYAPGTHIEDQLKKNGNIARAIFKNTTALKTNGNSYEFTLKKTEADALETVEVGFNTYETLPKGAVNSITKDYCK